MRSLFEHFGPRGRAAALIGLIVLASGPAHAQRTAENAVAEADDAFGTTVGTEVIGLYTTTSARGFNPSQAGNLRINGLYFDQAAAPVTRLVRGSTMHVGISAQGYPFPAPTGVVDFALRAPGETAVTSAVLTHGALFGYARLTAELDAQLPLVANKLSIGGGLALTRNNAHEVAVRDRGHNAALIAHWRPSERVTVTPFWSTLKTQAVGGDRPRIFVGDNDAPRFRAEDMTSPEWLFFGFRQYNYGAVAEIRLPDQWTLKAGVFRSENNTPRSFTAFLLNTDAQGFGDYAVEQTPPRFTRSTSGEARLAKTFAEGDRRHTAYAMLRGRERALTFGGGQVRRFGRARLGAFPDLPEPTFQTTTPTRTDTKQLTGGLGYEGVWRGVGQLSAALQKTDYERTLVRPGAAGVTGTDAPWLFNVGGAAYATAGLAIYAGYTRGLEEIGAAPGNAVNRDEAVPAQRTRQIDAGIRYQLRPRLQLVMGAFMIDKPYFNLDARGLYREVGDVRHTGVELSLAGPLTDELTVVAGVAALKPRITFDTPGGGPARLTAVGPSPRLVRVNLQYRVPGMPGLVLDGKIESVSKRYLTASNSRRLPGSTGFDAGVRYTTTLANVPVRFRLNGINLTNVAGVTPQPSGQVAPFEARRVELSVAADF
jgi:iron complex outermembrane receptor protein